MVRTVDGYESGHDAPLRATANALLLAADARSVVLVEGISDQIAIETAAARMGRHLEADGVVVIAVGGAQAMTPFVRQFGPAGADLRISGMCDVAEVPDVCRALTTAGFGHIATRDDLEGHGFLVCDRDLEDELIRAAGQALIQRVLTDEDELASFQRMQKQPAWRDAEFDAQFRRFLGAGARRKSRYARLLVEACDRDSLPRPLTELVHCA